MTAPSLRRVLGLQTPANPRFSGATPESRPHDSCIPLGSCRAVSSDTRSDVDDSHLGLPNPYARPCRPSFGCVFLAQWSAGPRTTFPVHRECRERAPRHYIEATIGLYDRPGRGVSRSEEQ